MTLSKTPGSHDSFTWLPHDKQSLEEWLSSFIKHQKQSPSITTMHPSVLKLRNLVLSNPELRALSSATFDQVPDNTLYAQDLDKHRLTKPRNFQHMLQVINQILLTAPQWNTTIYEIGFVGIPMHAILNWPLLTPSGRALFLNSEVNKAMGEILNAWGKYLSSEPSTSVLHTREGGWLSKDALTAIERQANNNEKGLKFEDLFICDPGLPHWGFKSWDEFFIRKFQPGMRPIAAPEDDAVIVSPCESAPFRLQVNSSEKEMFWIKSHRYSMLDMLSDGDSGDELAQEFIGGTVYQAFLSALSYHRWHSPVNGAVVKVVKIPGTYYTLPIGQDPEDIDHSMRPPVGNAQSYLAEVSTRAVIYIRADNPKIGLMCVVTVGMVEVSTCDVTVKAGQRVKKGEELGMFHYGGSTYCMVFRGETVLKWKFDLGEEMFEGSFGVNSEIARVV